mgnify:CR=1 FL=1
MIKKKNLYISIFLIFLSVLFTILVKVIDVKPIGPNNSKVGFSFINEFFHKSIGVNMVWYKITYILGIIIILIAVSYALIGIIQLLKRKSIKKVDREIILLGIFYIVIAVIYVFFEKFIVNYRPILMEGVLSASYPSSHTMLAICICVSSIMVNNKIFKNEFTNSFNVILFILLLVVVIGRFISGVHWASDIIGGIIISSSLLMSFYTVLDKK